MIKLLLKHIIYETCISVFFERLTDGFLRPVIERIGIPLVRKMMPSLFSANVVGVQPMNKPTGIAFALRYVDDKSSIEAHRI